MTVEQWLRKSTDALKGAGIETARLDCLVLLEDSTNQNRASLLAHPEQKIPTKTEVKLNNKIVQRSKHIPLAYIRGKVEFYGRQFAVTNHVMVPRPETETVIELIKELAPPPHSTFLDVGTGSGAIASTAKLEMPGLDVYATDISEKALLIARRNATNLHANVRFKNADLIPSTPKDKHYWLIAANLPYVPDDYQINEAARFEPKEALFAGRDGLDLYRRFWTQIKNLKRKPEYIITESLSFQHDELCALAAKTGYSPQKTGGLVQLFSPKR